MNGMGLVTTKEAAVQTGMHISSVARAVKSGHVAAERNGNSLLVDLDSLRSYIASDPRRRPRAARSKAVKAKTHRAERKRKELDMRERSQQSSGDIAAKPQGLLSRMDAAEAMIAALAAQVAELASLLR